MDQGLLLSSEASVSEAQSAEPNTVTEVVQTYICTQNEVPLPSPNDPYIPEYNEAGMPLLIPLPPPGTTVTTQPHLMPSLSSPPKSAFVMNMSTVLGCICFSLGSPLTLICFITAIWFSARIDYYNNLGMFEAARRAKNAAFAFNGGGFLTGFFILCLMASMIVFPI